MADAAAICEAVTRPTMRFVEIKTPARQSVLMLHRTLQLFVRQRTTPINTLRTHLAEFGIVAGVGRNGLERLLKVLEDGDDERVPPSATRSSAGPSYGLPGQPATPHAASHQVD